MGCEMSFLSTDGPREERVDERLFPLICSVSLVHEMERDGRVECPGVSSSGDTGGVDSPTGSGRSMSLSARMK
jgi:hypothetical protein